ncbi:MAG: PilZ domain-containing protein [Angelakisella sp.]|nr:PilZ domain-containing protein [Angelakisella sp.]
MLPIPQEYKSSICEIKTLENELIAAGIIREITDEYIEITAKSGTMDIVRYGTPLKINVFNHKQGIRVLRGNAYISSVDFIRVVDVVTVLDHERRNFFRVSTNMSAFAQIWLEDADSDPNSIESLNVKVKNLSLGGALIITDRELKSNQQMYLIINLDKQTCRFRCSVKRIENNSKHGFMYGCKFYEAPDSETSALCAYIFKKQREQINRKDPNN